jgi:hypothetical protein
MYTFRRFIKDEVNKSNRRREMVAEFVNEKDEVLEKDLSFDVRADENEIKKRFKQIEEEFNLEVQPITDINYVEPEPSGPTARELAKQDFDASVAEYKYLKEMNEILPAVFTQWMLDNQVVICQQKYQIWQSTP